MSIGISPALFVNPIRFNPFDTVSLPAGVPSSISTAGASEITLTLKESALLEHIMLHKEMVCSKEQIIEKLWGFDSEAESNHVEVYISFLRKKLAFVHSKVSINTVRGVGYTLSE